jgi:hypothetical protein
MGVCPSPFPLNCYGSACSFESHAVWHLLALRRGVLSMPELLRRLALAVRCGAFAPAVRCLSSGSSREKMAGLPAAHVPRQLSCSASGVKCMGIYIFSRAICFVSRLRCVGSRVFQPVLESLGRCRRCVSPASKCRLVSWRAQLRSAGFRRSFLLALSLDVSRHSSLLLPWLICS